MDISLAKHSFEADVTCSPVDAFQPLPTGVDKKEVQVLAGLASRGFAALPQTPAASGGTPA
ncbi:hypothetical protein ABBQ32_004070 [Trebouxia sp. C0010 RCD-2024]